MIILQDECKRVSTEGQSLRLDLSARFQDAIKVQLFFLFDWDSVTYLDINLGQKVA